MKQRTNAISVKWILAFVVCAIVMSVTHVIIAKDRFSLQIRPGVSFATTDVGDVKLRTGFGFELEGTYRFMPYVSIYAGWGWNRFGSNASFAGRNAGFEETGYVFGLQFLHPFHERLPFDYFLKGGAIYNHIEAESADGDIFADSGHGFGFQVETGLAFLIAASWRIIPGIKYQTLSRGIEIEGFDYEVDLNYLSVGATISKTF